MFDLVLETITLNFSKSTQICCQFAAELLRFGGFLETLAFGASSIDCINHGLLTFGKYFYF
jgi:hypothetical protein